MKVVETVEMENGGVTQRDFVTINMSMIRDSLGAVLEGMVVVEEEQVG